MFVCLFAFYLFVCFYIIMLLLFVSRLGVVRAAVGVVCYLAVLFRKCTCYHPVMEHCMYCNDAFLERIKTDSRETNDSVHNQSCSHVVFNTRLNRHGSD